MKKIIILSLIGCYITVISAIAQTSKTDQIVKMDNSIILALIDEVTETEIFYKLPSSPKGAMQKIERTEVLKIIYAAGNIDEINKPLAKAKTDRIIRKDGGVVEGIIVSISAGKVEYKNINDDGLIYMLSGADVAKVEYADGTIKDLSLKSKKEKTVKEKTEREKIVKVKTEKKKVQSFENQVTNQQPVAKPRQLLDIPRFVIGIGGEGTYALEPLSKKWVGTNDSLGIQQGFGVSIRTDVHLSKFVAFSFSAGINQWQIQRNYILKDVKTQTTTTQYSSLDKFVMIPLQAGFKFYIAKGFYIMPEASFNIVSSDFKNNDGEIANPNGNTKISSSLSKVGYGGSIGAEVYKLPFVIDISARLHTVKAEDFRTIGEPLYFAGLRLGIGLAPKK
ncbi:hypothetical protein VB796_18505 [Arcicella sp. LKC2W]|uniref:hypothetical protein n=1 Tax=Arcicella sp. LKC2W TaxID=2984198 RepID=UPI002B1FDCA7|nr:hypothetical protein [Arcicella sp. LKC2W]MEA5461060.1 hypothetical protein [Arcicella sp. LKC2W]